MEIRCPNCKEIFIANAKQEELFTKAISNNQRLLMVECSQCYKDVPINPMNLMSFQPQKDEVKKEEFDGANCPSCNDGIISFIDNGNEKFWGCGECGNVWQNKKDLANQLKT